MRERGGGKGENDKTVRQGEIIRGGGELGERDGKRWKGGGRKRRGPVGDWKEEGAGRVRGDGRGSVVKKQGQSEKVYVGRNVG